MVRSASQSEKKRADREVAHGAENGKKIASGSGVKDVSWNSWVGLLQHPYNSANANANQSFVMAKDLSFDGTTDIFTFLNKVNQSAKASNIPLSLQLHALLDDSLYEGVSLTDSKLRRGRTEYDHLYNAEPTPEATLAAFNQLRNILCDRYQLSERTREEAAKSKLSQLVLKEDFHKLP